MSPDKRGNKSVKSRLIAIGGGKGGVGKSFISSSIAIAMAQAGHSTTIVDLDLGGANLHSLFGLKTTETGIGDYIYRPVSNDLSDYAVDVGIKNLSLISGNGFIPGIANIEYQRKVKIIKALSQINSEFIIMDLGAGSSFNVIDFFTITKSGMIVTMHEPTAILNAYEFLKNVLFRIYAREFKNEPHVLSLINKFKTSEESFAGGHMEALISATEKLEPSSGALMRRIHSEFQPALVVNMTRENVHDFTKSLKEICRGYLNINIKCLEGIPDNPDVKNCCVRMKPYLLAFPESSISVKLRAIAEACIKTNWTDTDTLDKAASAEETEQEILTPEPADLQSVIHGKPDSELPALLSDFLKESAEFTVAGHIENNPRPDQTQEDDNLKAEHALIEGVEISNGNGLPAIIYPVALRMRPDAEYPFFAPPRDNSDKTSPGLIGKLFGKHLSGQSGTSASFEKLRNNLKAKDIGLSFQTLSQQSECTRENGNEWLKTGLAFMSAHQIQLARQAFENANACLPNDETALNNKAAILIALGNINQALKLLQNASKQHKTSIALCFNLGLAYTAAKQHKEAVAAFTRARSMAHGDTSLPSGFLEAYNHYKLGDFQSAEMIFRSVAEHEPQDMYTAFNLGLCEIRCEKFEEAVKTFSALLAESPGDAEALALRGISHCRTKGIDAALSDLSGAVRHEPANIALYTTRAAIARQANRLDIAIADIQSITRLLPENRAFKKLLFKIRSEIDGR